MALITVSGSSVDPFSDVAVALQADGNILLSWEAQIDGTPDANPDTIVSQGVYIQRFSPSGQPLTDPILVASEAGQAFDVTERGVSVATSLNGTTLLAYLAAPSSTASPNQIVVQPLGSDLSALSAPVSIMAPGLGSFSDVAVTILDDGSFAVAWEGQTRGLLTLGSTQIPDAILSQGVYVQHFGSSGVPIAAPILLTSESGLGFDVSERRVSVTATSTGGLLVAYLVAPDAAASPTQIVVGALDANLAPISAPVTISASGLNTFSDVSVAERVGGGFVLTWEGQVRGQLGTVPNAILSEGVFAQSFGADGNPFTPPIDLSAESGLGFAASDRRVSISTLPDGKTLIAYLSAPQSDAVANQIIVKSSTGNTIPCLAAGSLVAAERGMVAIEDLAIGDIVITVSGRRQAIQWIGYRHVDCRRHADPERVWPIEIAADAFGLGRPARPLLLSPDHAVFVEDVLIPVRFLLNGRTIVQRRVDAVTYYHIELPQHDVLLAEGLPVESYLDTGGRAAFSNAGPTAQLHADFFGENPRAAAVWHNFAYAPLLGDGNQLERARTKLAIQAALLDASGSAFDRRRRRA